MSNPLLAFRRDEDFSFGGAARGLPPGVHLDFYNGGNKGGGSTQTVSIPPEVLARYNAVNARAENVAQTPFTPYSTDPNAFVAGLTSSQQAGIGNINAQQGAANQAVGTGQDLQMRGINTAQIGQAQANAINQAALQGISQAQQQGTAYNQAAGKNIGNAMSSAAPYMQQMAGLTQAGLGQGQQYLGGATDLTQRAIQTGQQYAGKAEPYYTGALQASQPLNQQAQQYMQAGTQAVNPNALDYGQYMNPYMSEVVQAQQALQAQENAQQRSALQGKAIQSGAFGGNRSGIEQANLARQQSLANQATMANLLQSGYGQAQAAAQQQQGVGLGAAQANRAAQQAAAQQAAALGQQQYAQQLGVGTGLAALGQQQYGQALGTGAQIGQLGQQGFGQNMQAGAQMGQVGQNLYAQNIGQGQAIQGLGNQQFTQGLQGSQAASGIGQNIFGNAAQTAGIQQAGGMNTANLGLQNQAAQIAAAQAQMAAGQQQQQTEQAGKTALYNQFLQQQGYPFQITQFLGNLAMGTGALSGSTTSAARTGQRGGRMGDGYASGGLVPDSQGGAVYEPGLYERGGYASGGKMGPDFALGSDQDGNEVWTNLATGRAVNAANDPEFLAWRANGNVPVGNKKTAPTTSSTGLAGTSNYDQVIRNAYGQIGRKDFGTAASNIDEGGYNYWMNQLNSGTITPDQFYAQFMKGAQAYNAADPKSDVAKLTQPAVQSDADYRSVSGVNPDIADAFKEAVGRDIDGASARKYQAMMDAGLSLDQITYNIANSQPAKLKAGDVDALKGPSLAYDASKFSQPVAPVRNQYGSFSAGDFTPGAINLAGQQPGYGQPQGGGYSGGYGDAVPYGGYGNMSAIQGGYGGYGGGFGGYGGGMMGGYGQPSNYGMPNFGSSPQYGGAPDYAGAMQYGGMQAQYGMPQGYGMPQQATGKGAQPAPQQQAPQASGKGASQAPQATGKGASGMAGGGRAGFADGGRAGYAAGGGDPSSVLRGLISQYDPGDPQGLVARQAAMFAGAPGAGAAGYVPPTQSMAGQRQMLQPQASILPQQQGGIQQAIGMGTSIASLGEAGSKLYDKLKGPSTTAGQDAASMFNKMGAAKQVELDTAGGLTPPSSGFKLFGENSSTPDLAQTASIPDALQTASFDPSMLEGFDPSMLAGFAANGGRIGHNSGGRASFNLGGIPGLNDLKQGYAGIPGNEGMETPMSQVVAGGTKTPTELKAEMDRMSGGAGGGGGSSGGGMGSALGTAASVASLGSMAFKVGGWMMGLPIFASGGRVGKAGGGSLVDPSNPQDQAMAEAFDNLLQRYDNNPLLAAAAMDVGTKVVDAAIQKAEQTGGDITDFLPRRTQEYMFALSKAAMGAHDAMSRPARAAGGRTGYAFGSDVVEKPLGLDPNPIAAPVEGLGLSIEPTPQDERVQIAGEPPTADKPVPASNGATAARTYFDYLTKEKGYDPHVAAGILGNAYHESKGLQPTIVGDQGNSIGLFQFHSRGEQPAFRQWAQANKKDVADPYAQLDFVDNQLRGPYAKTLAGMQTAKDPNAAAEIFMRGYERPKAGPTEALAQRQAYADAIAFGKELPKFGAAPTAPVQVAGLAPSKTEAGPFETIGKKILPDAVPTDSSFWVPLIAGLGTMLASDKYRFSQRIGEGLVGGAAAYGKQQEFGLKKQELEQKGALQQSEILKNTMGIAAARFRPLGGNKWYDNQTGQSIGLEEYQNRLSKITGAPAAASAVAAPATETSTAPVTAPTVAAATSKTSATEQAPAPAVSSAAAPAQVLPASIATQRVIYESIDLLPEVKAVKDQAQKMRDQAHQYLERANDPALMGTKEGSELLRFSSDASARANELQQQYRDMRDRLAKPEIDEMNRRAERSGRLEQVQPNAGGPTVYRTQEDILTDIKTNGAAQSANPGAGNPVSGAAPAAVVAKQPEYLAKRMENITENELKMGQQFKDRQPMRQRVDNLSQIVEAYQTGAFAENKADAIRWARSLGFDINDTDTANPAAFQKFRKNSISSVIEQAKSLAGPIAFKELDLIGKANTDADMEPEAVVSLLGDAKGMLNYEDKFYKDYAKWREANPQDPYPDFRFNIGWVENNPTSKYVEAAKKDVAALGQKLPTDPSKAVHGQKYILTRPGAFGPHYWDAQKQQFFRSKPAPLGD